MNILSKITLQNMKKNRTRTAVTIAGVILSAAMITAVAAFAASLQSYMVQGAVMKYGGWHVAFADVSAAVLHEISSNDEAEGVSVFENIGYAELAGGKNPDKPYLFIAGFRDDAFKTLPVTLVSGRMPQNSGEVLVPAHVAANGGVRFQEGDTLDLTVGKRMKGNRSLGQHDPYASLDGAGQGSETFEPETEKTYRVVGICERPSFEEYSAPGYTLITAADGAEVTEAPDMAEAPGRWSVFVTLKDPKRIRDFAEKAAGGLAYTVNDEVLRFMGLSDDTVFNDLLYSVAGILIVLIMTGSVFLIYNSFSISLNERTRQLGILSSVGATKKQLRSSVLLEGLCIGAAGVPAGVLVGIGSAGLVIRIVAGNFGNVLYSGVPLTLKVSISAIAVAAAVSMAAILISAYIPARKAAGTPVMENIRQTNEVRITSGAVKTSKLTERICGVEGTLAVKNFKRNRRRYRSIVLSLTLSLVLFISANAFGTYLKQAAERSVVESDYDICFYTEDMEEGELFGLYRQFRSAAGVYESSYQAISTYSCEVNEGDLSEAGREYAGDVTQDGAAALLMDIQFVEDSVYLGFIEDLGLPAEEYTGPDAELIAVAKVKRAADGESGKSRLADMFADRSMDLWISPESGGGKEDIKRQNIRVRFADTFPVDTLPRDPSEVRPYVFMAVAPYQMRGRFAGLGAHEKMGLTFLSSSPAQSAAEMESALQEAGVTSEYTLYNVHKMFEQNRNILFVIDVFTFVFVIMISLIATANVFNTISTNIRLRRRELAMLRSVGMSDRVFRRMMNFECALYGMRTLLFGLPTAGILVWLIYRGLLAGGADIDFALPWGSIAISIFGVFFIIFITMLYAAGRIKRENIIDALRDDLT